MPSKIIDNFSGRLTRQNIGDCNSGLVKFNTSFGYDPFSNPSNLTWLEQPTQIDPNATVITDLIVATTEQAESDGHANDGVAVFQYAVGHTGRVYKIQVNDPNTVNPTYSNPVLLTTLTVNSPTFKYGSSITIYGATPRLFIGWDSGVTRLDTNGANEVAVAGTWSPLVPRPCLVFQGKMYFGNNNNIAEVDSTLAQTSSGKISPAFPVNTYVRDIDITPDGNYLEIVVTTAFPADLTSVTVQDTWSLVPATSYVMLWNGSDTGITSYTIHNGFAVTSNNTFGVFSYLMGYDLGGAALYTKGQKILTLPFLQAPTPQATFSSGNLLGWATSDYDSSESKLSASLMVYGQYDNEVPKGLFRFFRFDANSVGFESVQVPTCSLVSNLYYGDSHYGYTGNQVGAALLYFSVLGTDVNNAPSYRYYRFTTVPTGTGTAIQGVYETQQETTFRLFRSIISNKFKVTSVRLYTEPLVANNSFKLDLIGSDGNPMNGGSYTWTVGSTVNAGDDVVKFTPATAPTYSVGFRITNLGTKNWTGIKLEFDYQESGY